ncbi:MAG: D-glycero-beta-D-manno-heptose-7-phosphate kinase [Hyphomonadaceae bacterium]|nr:D-glycero-beta-D-manno-heptose-7-phosphate kinase [Hyphomonadaceae bacterium]
MQISAKTFAGCRILVIGDLVLDRFTYGDVDRISPEAPVPVLRVHSTKVSPGCAANVATNVTALGARAILIGVVGADQEARALTSTIAADFEGITFIPVTDTGRQTATKTRYIAAGQQVLRADREVTHAVDEATENRVLEAFRAALKNCDVIVISDYNKGLLTDRVLRAVIDEARQANRPVLVDPKRVRLAEYRGATLIKPNRKELVAATGLPCSSNQEAAEAARQVVQATGAMILLTRSEQGMSLFRAGTPPLHVRGEAREVFDVSGAGDTTIATLAVALAAGLPIEGGVNLANTAAGIVVGKVGTATVRIAELTRALGATAHGFHGRIVDLETALRRREEWRQQGLVCGFTNGCFDLIHPGHISLLAQAKRLCDRLIVALNSDQSVRRLKGPDRPLQVEQARAYVMASIEHPDLVVIFEEDTPLALIEALRPDLLVKGADYREDQVVGAELVRSWGGKVALADIVPDHSTTGLVQRSRGKATAT